MSCCFVVCLFCCLLGKYNEEEMAELAAEKDRAEKEQERLATEGGMFCLLVLLFCCLFVVCSASTTRRHGSLG